MAIVTLTTDLGTKDFYSASIKGRIYSLCPQVTLVDITHEIPPFDIQAAAFSLRNAYPDFPEGSIHIIGVNPIENEQQKHVIVFHEGHYFIGSDNGIFSMLFNETPQQVWRIKLTQEIPQKTFLTKDVFATVAAHIANGMELGDITSGSHFLQEKNALVPVVESDAIRGMAVYIDAMGNITTNITKQLFKEIGLGRDFEIAYRRADYSIKKISSNYDQVPEGEKVALFNSFESLEIAINKGNASKLFGMRLYDIIRIDFK